MIRRVRWLRAVRAGVARGVRCGVRGAVALCRRGGVVLYLAYYKSRYGMGMLFTDFLVYRGPGMRGFTDVPAGEEPEHLWMASGEIMIIITF